MISTRNNHRKTLYS